ncbi:ankyrin repeat-containing domain protein [Paraphoma chrysanthemicola]|uniref:Ankyrin repeat-containing domain protein n=1 Tax=Paraphoma chrysanthemicola TaxID=798071 RepID=A0A8K0R6N1_9PLEO|nr:ankyrin repeat-containing domain protein [Paraphoma chrysanthemicola]
MSNTENYTVGWICALSTEYVAAQALLDTRHEGPESVSLHDNNDYTLGRSGKHNVVIAVLPEGEYGISSATSVARDMLHSFPNVRIGLMVGIAGGVPSGKHDIRLGDVVVSSPGNSMGGVLQYDFGKTMQDQEFCRKGFLNQPPMVLRTAISGLKAQYESDGHLLESTINAVLDKKPRLRKKFQRPSPSSDKLYVSHFKHPLDDGSSCATVCGSDSSNLISRDERDEDEDNPTIHYGLIASANQLMQDAMLRDKLSKEMDVLCFEMEAAGLMNQFPCLVIRGICDYSDTHKNKEWQGYAAMAAAAYAKDILSRIPPNKIEAEQKISRLISSVREEINDISRNIKDAQSTIQDISFEQRRGRIAQWLSPPDPSTSYNNALQQRQSGTGLWLLEAHAYINWKVQRNSTLLLYGMAGCGKTVLSSTIVEDLQKTSPRLNILYFYFDFSDPTKQTLENMVRSFVNQLDRMHEKTPEQLASLFSSCEQTGCQPRLESLCQILFQVMDSLEDIYVVIDALDECQTRRGPYSEGLLSWIMKLFGSGSRNVHFLATSRPEHDIETKLNDLTTIENIILIHGKFLDNDIHDYVRTRIRVGDGLKRWRRHTAVQEEIESALMQKANGMFRWTACQLDALENCLDYRALTNALACVPRTLDETYSRILEAIPVEHKRAATLMLQLLAFSERPLRLEEAIDAIAVEPDGDPYFSPIYRMPDPLEIIRYCSSLVTIYALVRSSTFEDDDVVVLRLAHYSVKEYLISDRTDVNLAAHFREATARPAIAKVCLAYLLHFEEKFTRTYIKQQFPFAVYSATYWMAHALVSEEVDMKLLQLIEQLFLFRETSYKICYSLYSPDDKACQVNDDLEGTPPPLYHAALGGLFFVVDLLLNRGTSVNAQGGYYRNALQAASVNGDEAIVRLLLKEGADINAQGGAFNTALIAASNGGNEQLVVLLLDAGANVNAPRSYEHDNAIFEAIGKGHERIVQLLLERGAKFDARNYDRGLETAVQSGHMEVVKVLFKWGSEFDMQPPDYSFLFHIAAEEGHEQMIKLLLDSGAEKQERYDFLHEAIWRALANEHERIVDLLVKFCAENCPEQIDQDETLCDAAVRGYEQAVRMLLDMGVDADTHGPGEFEEDYGTPLCGASYCGQEQVVKLLLSRGANVNAEGGDHGNALSAASEEGETQIVKLLLSNGADVNLQGGKYGNALQAAASSGHKEIVLLLLKSGADIKAQGGKYGNALQAAASEGHKEIVTLLIENGADTKAQEGQYGNALQAAASSGHKETVTLLIKNGADTKAQEGQYGNPLQAAASEGHKEIVTLLLENGADIKAQGGQYGNALQAAASKGHKEIVTLLIEKGADINSDVLHAALHEGHEHIVQLLVDKGAKYHLHDAMDLFERSRMEAFEYSLSHSGSSSTSETEDDASSPITQGLPRMSTTTQSSRKKTFSKVQ